MKKTVLMLLILLALGGIAWYTTQNHKDDSMPASTSLYAIDDVNQVMKIGLIYTDRDRILLERVGSGWTYNKKAANHRIVDALLQIVKKQRILYATPKSMKPTMLKSLATHKVKVEIFGKDDKLLQQFYVGSVGNDGNSTFFIKEGSNEPHLVGVPGLTGTVHIYYYHPESDWVDKTLFKEVPSDITAINVDYPNMQNRSFRLAQKGGQIDVVPLNQTTTINKNTEKKGAKETFLRFFENIGAEAFEPNIHLRDSLIKLVPFVTLQLEAKSHHRTLKVYPFLPEGTQRIEDLTALHRDSNSPIGTNRYYVIDENNKLFLSQHRVLGKVLWAYDDFFDK